MRPISAEAYLRFLSMKRLEVFLLILPDGMLVHRSVSPSPPPPLPPPPSPAVNLDLPVPTCTPR